MSEQHESLETRLQEALTLQTPLLQAAPTNSLRRQAAGELLKALSLFLEEADRSKEESITIPIRLIQKLFSVLLSELGPGDGQVRGVLLKLLSVLKRPACWQVILDFLPSTMPLEEQGTEDETKKVIEVLHGLVLRDLKNALLPVLGCLSMLPLPESGRSESFELALTALPICAENNFPTIVRTLLRHVTSEEDALSAWTALRKELRYLEEAYSSDQEETSDGDPLVLVAHVVLSSFTDIENGDLLVKSYIKKVKQDMIAPQDGCVLLDLAVLLALSQQIGFSDSVDRILDSWIVAEQVPLTALQGMLRLVCGHKKRGQPTSLLYKRLAPALLRFSIFLLLAPARVKLSQTTIEQIHTFVLDVHHRLDRERQAELVQGLLHLNEESVVEWDGSSIGTRSRKRKRPRRSMEFPHRVVHHSVNVILQSLAETSPSSLVRFKHILIARLTSTSYEGRNGPDRESVKEICCIMSRLVESDRAHASPGGLDSSEMMMLLQKLLFSSSRSFSRAAGDSTRVVRGLMLATELIRSSSLSTVDQTCVKEWVLQVLLPATRRMVDPELGSPGLEFLEAWMRLGDAESARQVFQHFKMVLANTGLIQMLQHYQQNTKKESSILGYTEVPQLFASASAEQSKTREMVFCISFFLRRTDMHCPSRWMHTSRWVFELVDTYLRLGRERASQGWRPHGWLRASMEFPDTLSQLRSANKGNEAFLAWIQEQLCGFDVTGGFQQDVCRFTECLRTLEVKRFIASIFHFVLSLWTGVGLSAAVLKNSFAHYKALADGNGKGDPLREDELLHLIQFQLVKIYDMREKIMCLTSLLRALRKVFRCGLGKQESRILPRPFAPDRELDAIEGSSANSDPVDVDFALAQIRVVDSAFFQSRKFIAPEPLWESLVCVTDERIIRQSLDRLKLQDPVPDKAISNEFRLIRVKSAIADHLSRLGAETREENVKFITSSTLGLRFAHCLRMCCFLIDALPVLRKGYFAKNGLKQQTSDMSMQSVLFLTASYLHLLRTLIIESSKDRNPDPSGTIDFGCCLAGCKSLPEFLSCLPTPQSSPTVYDMFECFLSFLRISDTSVIADALTDILSILAFNTNAALVEKAIDASWASLHTVYAKGGCDFEFVELPFAAAHAEKRINSLEIFVEHKSLRRAIKGALLRLSRSKNEFNRGLLRHWGLLTHSPQLLARYEPHLSKMIFELGGFVESLHSEVCNEKEDEKKERDEDARKPCHSGPSLPFLNGTTFADFFECLLHMLVGALAFSEPSTKASSSTSPLGPYRHLGQLLRDFGRMLDFYQGCFTVFPRKCAAAVSQSSQCALLATISQLNRCVDWRSRQPLLSSAERRADAYDPGAMVYLQRLLETIASIIIGRIFSLCDFWLSLEEVTFLSRNTSLRQAAEKAAYTIKRIAAVHNCAKPIFECDVCEIIAEEMADGTNGFHTILTSRKAVNVQPHDNSFQQNNGRRILIEDSCPSSDEESGGSFAVAGDWGASDDDSDSPDGLDLDLASLTRA